MAGKWADAPAITKWAVMGLEEACPYAVKDFFRDLEEQHPWLYGTFFMVIILLVFLPFTYKVHQYVFNSMAERYPVLNAIIGRSTPTHTHPPPPPPPPSSPLLLCHPGAALGAASGAAASSSITPGGGGNRGEVVRGSSRFKTQKRLDQQRRLQQELEEQQPQTTAEDAK